jgi:hypothetical protein
MRKIHLKAILGISSVVMVVVMVGVMVSLGRASEAQEMSLAEMVEQADEIFIGVVKKAGRGEAQGGRTRERFEVVERVKGEVGAEVSVQVGGEEVEEAEEWSRYGAGERYLVFVKIDGMSGERRVQGWYRIESQTTDGRTLLWRVVGASAEGVEVEEIYLDEVRQEMRRILEGEEGR